MIAQGGGVADLDDFALEVDLGRADFVQRDRQFAELDPAIGAHGVDQFGASRAREAVPRRTRRRVAQRRARIAGDFEDRVGEIRANPNGRRVDQLAPVDSRAGRARQQTERGGHVDGRVRAECEEEGHGDDHRLGRQRVNVGDGGCVVQKDGEGFGGEVARLLGLGEGRLAALRAAGRPMPDQRDRHVSRISAALPDRVGDPLADDAGEVRMLAERWRVADQPPVALGDRAVEPHLRRDDRLGEVALRREQRHDRHVVGVERADHLMKSGLLLPEGGGDLVGDVERAQVIDLLPDDGGGFRAELRPMSREDEGGRCHVYAFACLSVQCADDSTRVGAVLAEKSATALVKSI